MGLYDFTTGSLVQAPTTTFGTEGVLERTHLQRALRQQIGVVGEDLLVVAEEFGDFADVRRRIDLLCVDHEARLVVVELKRTEDGGHMELQALRYAAMVSTMTVDQLVETYERHLRAVEPDADDDARSRLTDWLEDAGGEEAVLSRDVRVILVSAGFDVEITTTVLWLNDLYGMDIRCVRLTPYRVEGRLLLDVQPVIPLPEAEELTVRLRRRDKVARAASASGRDWTPYVISTPDGSRTEPLRKRQAIRTMVHALHRVGVPAATLATVLPAGKFLRVDGRYAGEDLVAAFVGQYPKARDNLGRWFLDAPLQEDGASWLLSKMWGLTTAETLNRLVELAPVPGFGVEPG